MKDNCKHEKFTANCDVKRVTKENSDEVKYFRLEVEIHCAECMMPFVFKGLPGGFMFNQPTVSVENTQARMPIEPLSNKI